MCSNNSQAMACQKSRKKISMKVNGAWKKIYQRNHYTTTMPNSYYTNFVLLFFFSTLFSSQSPVLCHFAIWNIKMSNVPTAQEHLPTYFWHYNTIACVYKFVEPNRHIGIGKLHRTTDAHNHWLFSCNECEHKSVRIKCWMCDD